LRGICENTLKPVDLIRADELKSILCFLMMGRGGCCGGYGGHYGHSAGRHDHYGTGDNGEYAIDPVCGMRLSLYG